MLDRNMLANITLILLKLLLHRLVIFERVHARLAVVGLLKGLAS